MSIPGVVFKVVVSLARETVGEFAAQAKAELVSRLSADAVAALEIERSTLAAVRKDLARQRELLGEERDARQKMIGQYQEEKAAMDRQLRNLLEGRDAKIKGLEATIETLTGNLRDAEIRGRS